MSQPLYLGTLTQRPLAKGADKMTFLRAILSVTLESAHHLSANNQKTIKYLGGQQ